MNTETEATYANAQIAQAMQSVKAATQRAQADADRPIFHFLPPAYWMNDPNGPIYHDGWYHLFYQHNPYGDEWGHMHWGHARSRDLVHWEHLPIALAPSLEAGEEHVFSGCAGVSPDGETLLLYTSVKHGTREDRPSNEQWAARPLDAQWLAWEKHPANPVLALETHGGPPFRGDWRDPFLFEAAGRNFLVLGAMTDASAEVALYEAVDGSLLRWRYCGPLVREERREGRFLECPNFVRIPAAAAADAGQWLLLTSPYNLVEYTTGAFDLDTFTFTAQKHGILDAGHNDSPNFYATNLLTDAAGGWVLLGWVRGFAKERGWNGALALPRLLTLDADGVPRQQPLPALQTLRGAQHSLGAFTLERGSMVVPEASGNALEIQTTLRLGRAVAAGLRVRSSGDGQRGVEIRWDGVNLTVAGISVALAANADRELSLQVYLDKCILEVFADGGRVAMTRIVQAPAEDMAVEVFAEQGAAHIFNLDVWPMNGIW